MNPAFLSAIMGQDSHPVISEDAAILAIFASCTQGCWYDPSDFSTMFQDAAGTVPVTAAGQPVGKILDKSGKNNHLSQATEANRPTLEQDSLGYYYLAFDGTDFLSATTDFSATDTMTLAATYSPTIAGECSLMSLGAVTSQAGAFDLGVLTGGILLYRSGDSAFGARGTASLEASLATVSATLNLAGDSHATENPTLRFAGDQFDLTDYVAGDTGGGNFGNHTFKLGGGLAAFDGRCYGAMAFDIILTAEQIETVEAYLNSKSGLLAPSFYSDSAVFVPETTYHYGSTFSHVDVLTSATEFIVAISAPIYAYYPQYAHVGVYVNDVYHSQIEADFAGMKQYSLTLDAGTKNIRFVHGLQSSAFGSFVTSIRANAPQAQTTGITADRMVAYGDSITVGSDASPIMSRAWAVQIQWAQSLIGQSVAVEAWGGRSLHEDCATAPARAIFANKIEAYNPSSVWMAIGTNDYGLNLWTAANFGAAYSALLDDLHTAMPDLYIYCQTPILRDVETANGLGSTLGDYRTAIATAVSTRTAFCELVDGTTFMTLADIPDGVHPNSTGHDLYAWAVYTAIN